MEAFRLLVRDEDCRLRERRKCIRDVPGTSG